MNTISNFLTILESFQQEGVDFIIIGGVAVILHGMPRYSEDVDIIIRMNDENISKIRTALSKLYKDESIKEITIDEIKSYSVLRYVSPFNDIIDIVGNLGEAFNFENIEFQEMEVDNKIFKIASIKTLIDMKSNTYREKDMLDLLFLKSKLSQK
jgi:hypothetical protein